MWLVVQQSDWVFGWGNPVWVRMVLRAPISQAIITLPPGHQRFEKLVRILIEKRDAIIRNGSRFITRNTAEDTRLTGSTREHLNKYSTSSFTRSGKVPEI
jgi:hypothetical protein